MHGSVFFLTEAEEKPDEQETDRNAAQTDEAVQMDEAVPDKAYGQH